MTRIFLLLISTVVFSNCKNSNAPFFEKDTTNINERNNTLFVFVGEKIETKDIPYKKGDFDLGITAKYKVLQRVYGEYKSDTIEFEAYDHYGEPPFTKYKNVLMFVSEDKDNKGKYYMEKYMYNDVYKTKNGRWAGSYNGEDYGHIFNKTTTVKPEKIDFMNEVSYPTKYVKANGEEITLQYPVPYYNAQGDKAVVIYGNYIEDLFRLKKEGFLTARKLFGNRDLEKELPKLADIPSEPEYSGSSEEFTSFWKLLTKVVKKRDVAEFKTMVFDTLWTPCNMVKPSKKFIKYCFDSVFNQTFVQKFDDTSITKFTWVERDYVDPLMKQAIREDTLFKLRTVKIEKPSTDKPEWWLRLYFIKTRRGFKLYSCDYNTDGMCCQ